MSRKVETPYSNDIKAAVKCISASLIANVNNLIDKIKEPIFKHQIYVSFATLYLLASRIQILISNIVILKKTQLVGLEPTLPEGN